MEKEIFEKKVDKPLLLLLFLLLSQISLEVFELAKMRLATHARTLKVHTTPCKDRKVSIGYDYSLYSRFVCSLSDVSRGFPTHGRPKSTPPRNATTDERGKEQKKRRKKMCPEFARTVRDANDARAYLYCSWTW